MSKKQESYYFQNFIVCAEYAYQAACLLKETMNDFNAESLQQKMDHIHKVELAADLKKLDLLNTLV